MDEQCQKLDWSSLDPSLEPGTAHLLFLRAIGGKPREFNLSDLATRTGLNVSCLWNWANGKRRWPVDAWLTTMQALGAATLLPDGTLKIS